MVHKDTVARDYTKVPTKELLKGLDKEIQSYGYGVRHVQLVIFFLCLSISFIVRAQLGVAVVAMTNETIDNTTDINIKNSTDEIKTKQQNHNIDDNKHLPELDKHNHFNLMKSNIEAENNTEKYKRNVFKTFNWLKPIQEMVLSSFFLGYYIMTFPIGLVTQRWGGKLPLQISLFVNGVVSILTPWLTQWGDWKAICTCRIVQGLAQAGTFPAIQALLAKWVPSNERGTLSSYVYSGSNIGTVIGFQISGVLAESIWGWPSIFWAVGVICIIGFAVLSLFGAATPSEHSYISDDEKNYILGYIDGGESNKKNRIPWKAILSSKPVWACLIAQTGSGVAYFFLFTQAPSYIHYVFGIDVKNSGLLTSFPYIGSFFTSVAVGLISDFCTNRGLVSIKNARRISNSIAQVGMAISIILASLASSTAAVVMCLVVGTGCQMATHTGWLINHIDIAPNYAGTVMSYGNIILNTFLLLMPVLVSQIVVDVSNQHQWRIMFFTVAGFSLVCNALFVFLMSSENQPWNNYKNDVPLADIKNGSGKDLQKS